MTSFDDEAKCAWASGKLFDLHDGRLDAAEAEALRSHLDACPHCRADAAWDERLGAALRDVPLPAARGRFEGPVLRRLACRRLWHWSMAASAALAVGVVAWQSALLRRP